MVNDIRIETYEKEVTDEIYAALKAFLEEAGAEVESQAMMNTPVASGQLKGNWGHRFKFGDDLAIEIGNTSEHAIWMEYGTGEYALEGKGRKGGWYIPIDTPNGVSMQTVEKYGWPIKYGKDGMKYAYTKGALPRRMLYNAMQDMAGAIQSRADDIIGGRLGGD